MSSLLFRIEFKDSYVSLQVPDVAPAADVATSEPAARFQRDRSSEGLTTPPTPDEGQGSPDEPGVTPALDMPRPCSRQKESATAYIGDVSIH